VIEFELHSVECVDVVAGQCKWAAKRWEKSPPAAVPAVKQIVYSRRCRATSLFFIDNLYNVEPLILYTFIHVLHCCRDNLRLLLVSITTFGIFYDFCVVVFFSLYLFIYWLHLID